MTRLSAVLSIVIAFAIGTIASVQAETKKDIKSALSGGSRPEEIWLSKDIVPLPNGGSIKVPDEYIILSRKGVSLYNDFNGLEKYKGFDNVIFIGVKPNLDMSKMSLLTIKWYNDMVNRPSNEVDKDILENSIVGNIYDQQRKGDLDNRLKIVFGGWIIEPTIGKGKKSLIYAYNINIEENGITRKMPTYRAMLFTDKGYYETNSIGVNSDEADVRSNFVSLNESYDKGNIGSEYRLIYIYILLVFILVMAGGLLIYKKRKLA